MIGATLWGNRGAEAMITTTVGLIRRYHPDARFVLYSYLVDRDRELLRDDGVEVFDASPIMLVLVHFPFAILGGVLRKFGLSGSVRWLPRSMRRMAECDVLVDMMGISFADGREKFLPFNILSIWPAMLLGVPVVKLSQAMGPFRHALTRCTAKWFVRRCRFVVARGRQTSEHLHDLHMPEGRWCEAADLAFLYEPEFSLTCENESKLKVLLDHIESHREEGQLVIGISPSMVIHQKFVKHQKDYVGRIIELIRAVLGRGHRVVVLPNATREGSNESRNNDLPVIEQLRRRMGAELCREDLEKVDWLNFDANTDGIRRVIAGCDALVTSRFHAMIGSLALRTPVLVVGWSHKYKEVLSEFGLEQYVIDFQDIEVRLSLLLDDLLNRLPEIRQTIARELPRVKASAASQFRVLNELLS